jgi:hypothetical protein
MTSAERQLERDLQLLAAAAPYALLPYERRALVWRMLVRAGRSVVRAPGARTPGRVHSLPEVEKCSKGPAQPTRD